MTIRIDILLHVGDPNLFWDYVFDIIIVIAEKLTNSQNHVTYQATININIQFPSSSLRYYNIKNWHKYW